MPVLWGGHEEHRTRLGCNEALTTGTIAWIAMVSIFIDASPAAMLGLDRSVSDAI